MIKKISVAWEIPEPPVAAILWHRFATLPPAEATDGALEDALAWPCGTLTALRHGFALNLSRGTGWEDASLGAPGSAAAVAAAARVFKRGVASRCTGEPARPVLPRSGCYDITVHTGSPDAGPPAGLWADGDFTVVDGNVARLWKGLAMPAGTLALDLTEQSKTLGTVAEILAAARAAGSPKRWTIVGGGILADAAAFAAALVGADLRLVPTTLVAMADACVGGKTGVNFAPYGKNQLGLFYFPAAVDVWTGWLSTLPDRHVHAGGAECLKHAFLTADLPLASQLAKGLAARDTEALGALLPAVIAVKAAIVAKDPGEAGQRATLNFGHTLGHALEAVSQAATKGDETLLHGEAVGAGMGFALVLSRRVAGLDAGAAETMTEMLRVAGCAPRADELKRRLGVTSLRSPALYAELKRLIGHDKKSRSGPSNTSQWVLLQAPGAVARDSALAWTMSVFEAEVASAWGEFVQSLR